MKNHRFVLPKRLLTASPQSRIIKRIKRFRREVFFMKVLILTCNTGGGHNATAKSVAERFAEKNIPCEIRDALSFVSQKMSDFVSTWHVRLYRHAPILSDYGYEFAEKHPSVMGEDSATYAIFKRGVEKLRRVLIEGEFSGVLCVHVFPALMMTELLKKNDIPLKTGFVATDYTCSPGVSESNLDVYFIPHENLAAEFSACGVPEGKLLASGIPVRKDFFIRKEKSVVKEKLGIPRDARHLLMMCGSMGCGPMEQHTAHLCDILPSDAYLTVVCGTNEKLRKKLLPFERENVRILGYADNVSELLDSADLYMTKPGGLSTTEAVRKRLPLAFIDAVSGCEGYNRYFFLTHGMAIASNDPKRLPALCLARLYDDARLSKQRAAMEKEFTTDPAEIITGFFA